MNIIREYKEFNDITEDKIYNFSEYEPSKYNGNVLVDQIMEWLRAKLLDGGDDVTVPIETFFQECSVNKDQFLTFYNELQKTQKVKSFKVTIEGENITFNDFKNTTVEENKNENSENLSKGEKREIEDEQRTLAITDSNIERL